MAFDIIDDPGLGAGLESILKYNGFIINEENPNVVDRIKITKIDGLSDADIRDSREDNPGRHGQTDYTSLYGGRTISLTGYIYAGSLNKLRSLQNNLVDAFSDLENHDLEFLKNSYEEDCSNFINSNYENFNNTQSSIDDINTSVANQISINNETLVFEKKSANRKSYDCMHTMKFRYELGTTSSSIGVLYKRDNIDIGGTVSDKKALVCRVSEGLELYIEVYGDISYSLNNITFDSSLSANTDYWLRTYIIGNTAKVELWEEEPDLLKFPTYEVEADFVAAGVETEFGAGVTNYSAWYSSTAFKVVYKNLKKESIWPCDIKIASKKFSSISSEEVQGTNKYFKRDFMITLRASNPRKESSVQIKSQLVPTLINELGRTYDKGYDESYDTPLDSEYYPADSSSSNILTINNRGNFEYEPFIRLRGPLSNPVLTHAESGKLLSLSVDIEAGEYFDIDILNKTIKDQDGTSKLSTLTSDSDMFPIVAGENNINVATESFDSNSLIQILYRHAWI